MGFATLILSNLALILVNRTHSQNFWKAITTPNRAWIVVSAGALGALGLSLYTPMIRELFQFSFLHLHDIAVCGIALVVLVGMLYVSRFLYHPLSRPRTSAL